MRTGCVPVLRMEESPRKIMRAPLTTQNLGKNISTRRILASNEIIILTKTILRAEHTTQTPQHVVRAKGTAPAEASSVTQLRSASRTNTNRMQIQNGSGHVPEWPRGGIPPSK